MRTGAAVSVAFTLCVFLLEPPKHGQADGQQEARRVRKIARHFPERAPIDFAFEPEAARGPRVIVTNLYQEPLTAFVVQTEPKSERELPQTLPWDALESSWAAIPRGLSLIQGIPRIVGKPVPEAKLVAAVWEDGSTFGPDELLQRIYTKRSALAELFDRAVQLLETGLKQRWTREQYLEAVDRELQPPSERPGLSAAEVHRAATIPTMTIRGNLQGGMKVDGQPATLEFAVRKLIEICRQRRDSLEAGMPAAPR